MGCAVNRAELQARIHQHIATAVAAACEDIAEYTAGQVKAAVVPPVVRQRGEPEPVHLRVSTRMVACKTPWTAGILWSSADRVTCGACMLTVAYNRAAYNSAWNAAHNAGAVSRNTSQPAHNTERPDGNG
jgi:hypothetical protein